VKRLLALLLLAVPALGQLPQPAPPAQPPAVVAPVAPVAPAAAPIVPSYWLTFEALGADPTGVADSTAAIRAAFVNPPKMCCYLVPTNAVYRLTGTIPIFNCDGVTIRSLGGTDLVSAGQRGAEFQWYGPAGADSVFDVNNSRHITFENVSISCDVNPTPPAKGISFSQWPDPAKPPPATNCTACTVRGCTIVAPKVAGSFYGVSIAEGPGGVATTANCDFITVENATIQSGANAPGWGEGVHVGNSFNAKSVMCRNVSVSYASAGFHFMSGQGHLDLCRGNGNAIDYRFDGNSTNPNTVWRGNFEQSGVGLSSNGSELSNGPFLVWGNRWGSMTTGNAFAFLARQFHFVGNAVQNGQAAPPGGVQPPLNLFLPIPAAAQTDCRMVDEANLYHKMQINHAAGYSVFHVGASTYAPAY
jgi:hypothetical protein